MRGRPLRVPTQTPAAPTATDDSGKEVAIARSREGDWLMGKVRNFLREELWEELEQGKKPDAVSY